MCGKLLTSRPIREEGTEGQEQTSKLSYIQMVKPHFLKFPQLPLKTPSAGDQAFNRSLQSTFHIQTRAQGLRVYCETRHCVAVGENNGEQNKSDALFCFRGVPSPWESEIDNVKQNRSKRRMSRGQEKKTKYGLFSQMSLYSLRINSIVLRVVKKPYTKQEWLEAAPAF